METGLIYVVYIFAILYYSKGPDISGNAIVSNQFYWVTTLVILVDGSLLTLFLWPIWSNAICIMDTPWCNLMYIMTAPLMSYGILWFLPQAKESIRFLSLTECSTFCHHYVTWYYHYIRYFSFGGFILYLRVYHIKNYMIHHHVVLHGGSRSKNADLKISLLVLQRSRRSMV